MDTGIESNDLTRWEKLLLKVAREDARKEFRKAVRKAGNLLRRYARNNTPKVTGELRRSYRVKMRGVDTVEVGTDKFYARMVEEGHALVKRKDGRKETVGYVPGKHYFRQAVEQTEKELPALAKDFVRFIGKELGMDVSE